MSTTFTKAVRLGSSGAQINFGNPSLLNDGDWTFIIGVKVPTGSSGQAMLMKGDVMGANNGYTFGDIDFSVARATTQSAYRANPTYPYDAWVWLAFSLSRSTPTYAVYEGAYGGTVAALSPTDINPGVGAVTSDAAYPLTLGVQGGTNTSLRPFDVFFFGRWNSVLSGATISALCADMDGQAPLYPPALYCKPSSGSTSSLADISGNANDGAYAGTVTVVDGPDAAGGGGSDDFRALLSARMLSLNSFGGR